MKTKQEFLEKVGLEQIPSEDGFYKTLTAGIVFKASITVRRDADVEEVEFAEKELKERVWRYVYADRRKEFASKMHEFLRMSIPVSNFEKWDQLKNELMELASAQ